MSDDFKRLVQHVREGNSDLSAFKQDEIITEALEMALDTFFSAMGPYMDAETEASVVLNDVQFTDAFIVGQVCKRINFTIASSKSSGPNRADELAKANGSINDFKETLEKYRQTPALRRAVENTNGLLEGYDRTITRCSSDVLKNTAQRLKSVLDTINMATVAETLKQIVPPDAKFPLPAPGPHTQPLSDHNMYNLASFNDTEYGEAFAHTQFEVVEALSDFRLVCRVLEPLEIEIDTADEELINRGLRVRSWAACVCWALTQTMKMKPGSASRGLL